MTGGNSLEPERVIRALDATFEAWRAPISPWRAELARQLPIHSSAVIERGIRGALRDWTGDALRKLWDAEHGRAPGLAAVWLADTPPPGTFAALALPLLAGCAVHAKPASADPVSPQLFAESLAAADPGVAASLSVNADERALDRAEALVVYGSDTTVAELRERAGARLFVGYSHKLSVAAIGPGADLEHAASRLALDACLWDGRGCLSPAWVFVDGQERAGTFARALATALDRARTTLPRGALSSGEEVALRERRAREVLRCDKAWTSQDLTDWGVFLGGSSPGCLRNLPVVGVKGLSGLAERCAALAPHLSSLGHAGWDDSKLHAIVERAGGSRVCPVGRMQLPPLDWPHDGMGALQPVMTRSA